VYVKIPASQIIGPTAAGSAGPVPTPVETWNEIFTEKEQMCQELHATGVIYVLFLQNSMLYTQNIMTCYQNATKFSMKVKTKNYHNFVKFLHRQVGGIGGFSSDKKQRVARGGIETT